MQVTPIMSNNFSSNSYVVRDEKLCIIDPGMGIRNYGVNLEEVEIVLLTHKHYDHIANCSLFENAEIFIHEKDLTALRTGEGVLAEDFGYEFKPLKSKQLPEKIDLGSVVLEVVHTPGHTPGSVCFYAEEEKILFTGDLLFAEGIGRTDLPGGNELLLFNSLKKISLLNFETFLPGHGELGSREEAEQVFRIFGMI